MSTAGQGQLGKVVSWKVPSEVSIGSLRQAMRESGLDESLARDMLPRNALTRALGEMKKGRVIRKTREEKGHVYYQFTKEYMTNREVEYDKEAELWLDVDTGRVYSTVTEIAEEAKRLLDEHTGKRRTGDLTRLVQKVFDAHSADLVPIREQGGAYFVPDKHSELVTSAKKLLDAIGGKLRIYAVKLGDGETSESVAESLTEYLSDLIREFEASCEDVTSDSRKDVIERREGAVGELRQKLEAYEGLLSGYATAIRSKIDNAEAGLLRKLLESTTAPTEEEQTEPAKDWWETAKVVSA